MRPLKPVSWPFNSGTENSPAQTSAGMRGRGVARGTLVSNVCEVKRDKMEGPETCQKCGREGYIWRWWFMRVFCEDRVLECRWVSEKGGVFGVGDGGGLVGGLCVCCLHQ